MSFVYARRKLEAQKGSTEHEILTFARVFKFNKRRIIMRRLVFCCLLPIAILFATLQVNTSLLAQSIWLERTSGNSIAIEALKPNFDDGDGITFMTLFI